MSRARDKANSTFSNFSSTGIDDNADATAITIDSSENVLVGTTTFNTANVGHAFTAAGFAHHTRDANKVLILNRKTDDGDILEIRRDDTSVGSIGTNGDRLYFTTANKGFYVDESGSEIVPSNGSGTNTNNTMNLGNSSSTFKDLYLGGNLYIGGTGSANALDDYEEGTFTPTYTEGLTSVSYNFQQGKYTKIGRMVFFEIGIRASAATTNSNQIRIAGLPFTSSNTGGGPYGGAYLIYNNDFFRVDGGPTLLINYNDTHLLFYRKSDGSILAGNNGSVNELNDIYIVGQYTTDA